VSRNLGDCFLQGRGIGQARDAWHKPNGEIPHANRQAVYERRRRLSRGARFRIEEIETRLTRDDHAGHLRSLGIQEQVEQLNLSGAARDVASDVFG
jgi:hypothetical protein